MFGLFPTIFRLVIVSPPSSLLRLRLICIRCTLHNRLRLSIEFVHFFSSLVDVCLRVCVVRRRIDPRID